ncbi:MAG TPA: glucose-6-phosphate dehydrogenase [Naasia sp.]|jgi:glucose-6-phosphate 1-dehydrogenase
MASVSILILGGGGDLTKRLLLPGLASLLALDGDYDVEVIGASREEHSDEEWRDLVRDAFASADVGEGLEKRLRATRYVSGDATDTDELRQLIESCDGVPVIYFALPPAVTVQVCEAMRKLELPEGTRLALEKPFGNDQASARKLNRLLGRLVPEEQVFRIDHFLGMSTVLNILGLRFSNRLLEPVWNSAGVERVEIVFDETLGLEGRGGYYDKAGALVDMIQSHLLEVLALVAMETPPRLDEVELRSNIAQVLRSTRVFGDDPVAASRRGRYTAGTIGDRELPAYEDEEGVDPSLGTETLAQVTFEVNTPRWHGVPFVLRSGKAIGAYRTEVRVTLRPVAPLPGLHGAPEADSVGIDLMTGEIRMRLTMNGSGDPFQLERTELEATKAPGELLPYGEVLRGILDGDPLLAVRGDVAEQCWRIVQPVLDAWKADEVPLDPYPAGSDGPDWD